MGRRATGLPQRQVRKYFGGDRPIPEEWGRLLAAVDEAYVQFETDGKLTERTMELSSNELLEANQLLRRKYERDEAILESLRTSVRALKATYEGSPGDGTSDLLDLSNLIRDQVHLRAAAEEKIREQAALLDTANDAIYVCSLEGVIQYWNQGAERLYGWSRAETIDRPIEAFFPPEAGSAGSAERLLLERGSWSGERRQVTRAGQGVVVYSRLTLVRDAGNRPRSAFVINTDVTEKKELEAQLLRGQRMESLGALASGIAHDLNNVLVPVVLGIQLLRTAVRCKADLTTLDDMETSALRGAEIVRQVLTFARGVEVERPTLHPKHLLKEIEAITNTFPKNIRIQTESLPGLWPVMGDATQLHQALMKLCISREGRDAGRRHARPARLECGRRREPGAARGPGPRVDGAGSSAGPARLLLREGRGHGDRARHHGPDLRALLHDEGGRQGDGLLARWPSASCAATADSPASSASQASAPRSSSTSPPRRAPRCARASRWTWRISGDAAR